MRSRIAEFVVIAKRHAAHRFPKAGGFNRSEPTRPARPVTLRCDRHRGARDAAVPTDDKLKCERRCSARREPPAGDRRREAAVIIESGESYRRKKKERKKEKKEKGEKLNSFPRDNESLLIRLQTPSGVAKIVSQMDIDAVSFICFFLFYFFFAKW